MKLTSLELDQIKIKDNFWSPKINMVREVIIPYQWDAINDRIEAAQSSHSLENFRIVAGRSKGEFYGVVFQDTDVAKWLEAVGFSLTCYPDEQLEQTADEVIDIIAEAQCDDGYINTYFTLKEPEKRWKDLCGGHELYTAGHLMEAAVAYYQGTGKDKFLQCMCRFADLIGNQFGYGENQIHGYPGHQEVEIGLIKLYKVTGERRYLDQAKYFIDARGVGENYFLKELKQPGYDFIFPDFYDYDTKYSQSHLPVREQKTAEGHAVRAVYMYSAMADLAYEYQDQQLLSACRQIWDNIVDKRMYITGGIGSSGILERFTTDYDLPNGYNYSESCASIGLALFGLRMNQITRESKYVDIVEKAIYNTVLAGIALDGRSFFYVNPLEVWPDTCMARTSKEHVKPIRQKWFGVACCPPNIARTLASLGQYIYGVDKKEGQVFLNLFVSNKTEICMEENTIQIEVKTTFPKKNDGIIRLSNVAESGIFFNVRIPDYAKEFEMKLDGVAVKYENSNGYAKTHISKDTVIEFKFTANPIFMRANPKVREDIGKVAVCRGPLVYCLEEVDNDKNLSAIYVDTDKGLDECELSISEQESIIAIKAKGQKVNEDSWNSGLYGEEKALMYSKDLIFVPYYCWNNRGQGEMSVWIKEKC